MSESKQITAILEAAAERSTLMVKQSNEMHARLLAARKRLDLIVNGPSPESEGKLEKDGSKYPDNNLGRVRQNIDAQIGITDDSTSTLNGIFLLLDKLDTPPKSG